MEVKSTLKITYQPILATEILQKESWTYSGCGYWIDPVTKNKYQTDVAFRILKNRNPIYESSTAGSNQ